MNTETVSGSEFAQLAQQAFGATGWRQRLADALQVSYARVSQITNSERVSARMVARLKEAVEGGVGNPVAVTVATAENADSVLTDQELLERINKRFHILDRITDGVLQGSFRSLIVAGAPGVGKSYNLDRKLRAAARAESREYTTIRGTISAPGLYQALYRARQDGIVVIDDCDSVFNDEQSFNILKAALDTTSERTIAWRKQSLWVYRAEDGDDYQDDEDRFPDEFVFSGVVVFITNLNFREVITQGKRNAPHFRALMSRSTYLDLTLHSSRARMLRIRDVFGNSMAHTFGLSADQTAEILDFVAQNAERFDELSLRTMVHVANAFQLGDDWKEIVGATLMV